MIKTIAKCPNDMVMVFDEKGEQIPEYQGQYQEVKESILKDAPPDAIFAYWYDYKPELQKAPRVKW